MDISDKADISDKGIKFFIYSVTINKTLPYLPEELREIIWNYANDFLFLECKVGNLIIKLKYRSKYK